MITTTSCIVQDLVNETHASKLLEPKDYNLPESVIKKLDTSSHHAKKELIKHFATMVNYFIRSSWFEKKKLLLALMEELNNLNLIGLLINSIIATTTKGTIYACVQYSTNFVYDTPLNDHNRCLCPIRLREQQEADIKWYSTLGELEQILVFVGLLRSSSGLLCFQIYRELRSCYNRKLEKHLRTVSQESQPIPNLLASKVPYFSKPSEMRQEFHNYDPNNPFLIEVEKLRKNWDVMISKYQEQVEGKPQKEGKEAKKQEKGKKGKKGKDGKKDKKSKGKKELEKVDEIMILPFWIVMNIFDYLDNKTLTKIKLVNSYWTFAVGEIQKIRKAKKAIDKIIQQMEQKFNLSKLVRKSEFHAKKQKDVNGFLPKKRLIALSRRGAVIAKLKPKEVSFPYHSAFITDALQTRSKKLSLSEKLNVFTRDFDLPNTPSLYKPSTYIINELGFKKVLNHQMTGFNVSVQDIYKGAKVHIVPSINNSLEHVSLEHVSLI